MMTISPGSILPASVLLLSAYSLFKFLYLLILPYEKRRAALDASYGGRACASGRSDDILLLSAMAIAAILLGSGSDAIAFLGGLFVGATLIQLFFHAFCVEVPDDRIAPEPNSPLKCMSYAVQARPQNAWKEMIAYSVIVVTGVILHVT